MADQVKYTQKLKGVKVLILGGTSGIGYAIAEACLENHATVIVSSSNQDRIDQSISSLRRAYPSAASKVTGHACNLSEEATLESDIVSLLEKTGPGIDHVIHTAGNPLELKPLAECNMEHIKQVGMIRFFSYLMLGKHVPKYMNPGPASSITFTTAGVSQRPMPGWTVENGYITGQHGICRGLALDMKPIRVNLVLPGAVDTEFWKNSGFSDEKKAGFLRSVAAKLPTGRVPGPDEVAEAYVYLMKDHNITGSCISTNGGWFLV